jgi:hypothetical protein
MIFLEKDSLSGSFFAVFLDSKLQITIRILDI